MTTPATILVIDDEPNLCRTLALILKKAGYEVRTASNGAEIYRQLEKGEWDLIFLDLQMPDVSGMELLPQIRKAYPETPVLILTAHATLESAMEAVRQGARDYLLKPINPEQILHRIREVLAELQQPRRRREIVSQVQNLIAELRQINGDVPPSSNLLVLPPTDPARIVQCGPFTLDLHTRHVTLEQRTFTLPPTAFDYLVVLARHAPQPVPYQKLVQEAQGYQTTPIEAREVTRWHIHELRKAIEPDTSRPRYIITVRNVGYRLAL
ncbi:MAG: DNA-binding response regulator [Caldilineae bacterium]|nr:MAG: DNA-binding response regulator [Caldilineae bacterium]